MALMMFDGGHGGYNLVWLGCVLARTQVILGKAKVCTSFMEVPRQVDLGECTIGCAAQNPERTPSLNLNLWSRAKWT